MISEHDRFMNLVNLDMTDKENRQRFARYCRASLNLAKLEIQEGSEEYGVELLDRVDLLNGCKAFRHLETLANAERIRRAENFVKRVNDAVSSIDNTNTDDEQQ